MYCFNCFLIILTYYLNRSADVLLKMKIVLFVQILIVCASAEKTFFDTDNTFARYRNWVVRDKGILLFSFSTYKENALLLYTDGGLDGSQDFLKVQLVNQKMVVHSNFGSGAEIFEIGERLSNGVFHSVRIQVGSGVITVVLDDAFSKEQRFDNSAADNTLQLSSPVFIGGVSKFTTSDLIEPDMTLEPRFSGCISGLKFTKADGENLGTPSCVEEEGTAEGCEATACENLSYTDSCRNGGKCEPQLDGYVCNCEGTGYSADRCTTG